jgi:hypothetical protein
VKVHDLQNDALKKETTLMPLSSLLWRLREMFPPRGPQPKQEASQHNASKEGRDARRRHRCWHQHHSREGFRLTLRRHWPDVVGKDEPPHRP